MPSPSNPPLYLPHAVACISYCSPPAAVDPTDETLALQRVYTFDRHRYMKLGSSKSQNQQDYAGFSSGAPKGEFQRWLRKKHKVALAPCTSPRPLIDRRLGQQVEMDPDMSVEYRRYGWHNKRDTDPQNRTGVRIPARI